jgi:hypothetical protein
MAKMRARGISASRWFYPACVAAVRPRAQCLEPAQSFSRAQYSPGALRRAKAAQLLARGRAQPLLDGKNVRLIIEGRGGYTVGVNFEKSK